MQNKVIITIGLGTIILFIVIFLFTQPKNSPLIFPENTAGPTPILQSTTGKNSNVQSQGNNIFPSTPQTNPPVITNISDVKKMESLFLTRSPLSSADSLTREKLVNAANASTGILYQAVDFRIDYIAPADAFQAEILSQDIDGVKQHVSAWLISQGLDAQGICHLPIMFYLNYSVAESLRSQHIELNPLPSGC